MARAVLLYDRDCGFCRAAAAAVLAWDRRRALRPVAIQDPEADLLLGGVAPERRLDSWHLVLDPDADEEAPAAPRTDPNPGPRPLAAFSAGGAVAPLLRLLPGGAAPATVAARLPRATERAYRLVAEHRSLLGRAVPSALRSRADALIGARDGSGKRRNGR